LKYLLTWCAKHKLDTSDWTALVDDSIANAAISSGNHKTINLCFNHKLHSPWVGDSSKSPLLHAAQSSDPAIFKLVLNSADVEWTQGDLDQALMVSICFGKPGNFKVLHQYAQAQNPPISFELQYWNEALQWATVNREWESIRSLLKLCGASKLDCTRAFHQAVFSMDGARPVDSEHMLSILWAHDKVNLTQGFVDHCLFLAADNYQTEFVRWLLDECQADPEAEGGE
jgi:hypothetical protein